MMKMSYLRGMKKDIAKKYDEQLLARVNEIRDGINPQPFALLKSIDPGLSDHAPRCRRILLGRVFPGDVDLVKQMEAAKKRLMKVRMK